MWRARRFPVANPAACSPPQPRCQTAESPKTHALSVFPGLASALKGHGMQPVVGSSPVTPTVCLGGAPRQPLAARLVTTVRQGRGRANRDRR